MAGGRGRVSGFETLLRWDFSNTFVGWISYTLSRSERMDSGSSTWRLFDHDQPQDLDVAEKAGYVKLDKWSRAVIEV